MFVQGFSDPLLVHNHILCLSQGPRMVLAVQRNQVPQHGIILALWQSWVLFCLASVQARQVKLMGTVTAINLLHACREVQNVSVSLMAGGAFKRSTSCCLVQYWCFHAGKHACYWAGHSVTFWKCLVG